MTHLVDGKPCNIVDYTTCPNHFKVEFEDGSHDFPRKEDVFENSTAGRLNYLQSQIDSASRRLDRAFHINKIRDAQTRLMQTLSDGMEAL